jgi:exonuclease V gamma subunit
MTRVQRYIRHIFAPAVGELWTKEDLLPSIGKHQQAVDQPQEAKESLLKLVRLFLIGSRSPLLLFPNFCFRFVFSEYVEALFASVFF